MAEANSSKENIYNANDTLDINELASLNDDISPEFIEQLQNKVAQNASEFTGKPILTEKDDSELFEEVAQKKESQSDIDKVNENTKDNFEKKYKAKLTQTDLPAQEVTPVNEGMETSNTVTATESSVESNIPKTEATQEIEKITSGNIIEKPLTKEQIEYNESLDYLDNNIKYSKYVIYIDPENKDFIESLTVKERKNIINRILREQDDIAITKRRLGVIQTVIKHSIIAIITISIAIPVIYWTINASLEASINNYRRSQTIFKTLYREKGKIKTHNNY